MENKFNKKKQKTLNKYIKKIQNKQFDGWKRWISETEEKYAIKWMQFYLLNVLLRLS